MLNIPIIMPIEVALGPESARLLSSPSNEGGIEDAEYTVHETEHTPIPRYMIATPALMALNEIERAAEVSEYHDFGWWADRISVIRDAIKQQPLTPPSTEP